MRKFLLAACLAAGVLFTGLGESKAQAQFGGHHHHRAGCNTGYYGGYSGYRGVGVYGAGYAPYGGYYAAPFTPGFYPVGVYSVSRVGVSPYVNRFGGGYGNLGYYGGGYGNLGYPNTIGPRAVLRIGF